MKKHILTIVALSAIAVSSCKQGEISPTPETRTTVVTNPTQPAENTVRPADGKYPVMTFETKEHDFGSMKQNEKVEYAFDFVNTGEADLLITNAVGSCGCTVPEYPKDPIKPGQKAQLKVIFSSGNKHGQQKKTVTLTTNTETGREKLIIKASITESPTS